MTGSHMNLSYSLSLYPSLFLSLSLSLSLSLLPLALFLEWTTSLPPSSPHAHLQSRKNYTEEQLFVMQHPIYRQVCKFLNFILSLSHVNRCKHPFTLACLPDCPLTCLLPIAITVVSGHAGQVYGASMVIQSCKGILNFHWLCD